MDAGRACDFGCFDAEELKCWDTLFILLFWLLLLELDFLEQLEPELLSLLFEPGEELESTKPLLNPELEVGVGVMDVVDGESGLEVVFELLLLLPFDEFVVVVESESLLFSLFAGVGVSGAIKPSFIRFFCFMRRFWNQIFTWVSLSWSAEAISILLALVRYLLKWNSFSSSVSCLVLKLVLPVPPANAPYSLLGAEKKKKKKDYKKELASLYWEKK